MRVLLIDDDRDLVDLLRYAFQRDGYSVSVANDGESALGLVQTDQPDIVVLDLNLPKRNGMDLLRSLRLGSNIAIIVLTAINDEDHIVDALDAGADDYLAKPFRPRELRARVQALMRRARREPPSRGVLRGGEITLDPQRRLVTVGGNPVHLTHREFALLHYMMLNRNILIPVSDILDNVWGFDAQESDNVVQVTISRLRRKVEPDPAHPRYLFNVPGEGYVFREEAPRGTLPNK